MSIGSDFTGAVGTAGSLLQGASDTEYKNKQLDYEKTTSGLNYLKDASGKAIDFMTQVNSNKAGLMKEQMVQEGEMARKKLEMTEQEKQIALKLEADKAKHDYENFMTVTPELADGVFKSTKGKMDFRKMVGQRVLTKAFVPMLQIAARDALEQDKPKNSQKDLNALKSLKSSYEKRKKATEDPLRIMMAAKNQKIAEQLQQDQQWLKQNEAQYKDAEDKIANIGGLNSAEERNVEEPGEIAAPSTSAADIDSLIDKAFK